VTSRRMVWQFIEARDHRVMRRLNRWRAPRWLRVWMVWSTRLGDGWIWYSVGITLLLFGGDLRYVAFAASATAEAATLVLFRALKNTIIDQYRKKGLEIVDIEQVPEKYFVGHSTDDRYSLEELETVYHLELNKLSPQRRKVFEMSRHKNMTYPQIADNLNLSVKTVESHVSAALVYLRKSLRTYTNSLLVLIFLFFLK